MAIFKVGEVAICKGKEVISNTGELLVSIPKNAEFEVLGVDYCCYGQTIQIPLQTASPTSECVKCGKVKQNDGGTIWLKSNDFEKPAMAYNYNTAIKLEPKTQDVLKPEILNAN